ncbi:hybrid sensor histidine kinase/response regulator [Pseudomonas sp. CFBP 13710]|uniref:hybrid sensor histidine kinase/response regulator n=1 Tax=Pseudomonas sp. CFBP 13710 TaxID=2775311 RepID=UPI00177DF131|nr:PAS domain-containing sensor histidine kinase [Pseudomonas sp. CFBP 13710]MBD8732458.1 PAS domain-containing protein [Pseudomonas sp. CFBP 13710]
MPTQPPEHFRAPSVPEETPAQDAAERLQLALDTGAIVGTWVWDVAADHFSADERFARTFGLSGKVCAQGLPLEQAMASVHPQDRPRVEAAVFETLGNGGHYRCEYRVLQSDGSYRWIEANGHVEFDEAGRPHRFPGVLLDIQQRRSAEAERDRMTHLLRTFTAAVPGVVYAKDRQGRMLVANRGTTELIGKPPEQYIGRTDMEFLEDKVQARVIMETDRRIMEGRHTQEVEEEVRQADGTAATWLSLKTPLLDEDGEVIGLIGSSIDVTARKKAEAAVRELNQTLEERVRIAIAEREKAEAALHQAQKMEAVGQLTGGIAHDFNNLLAGLSGSLELMHMRLKQGRTADLERYLDVAQGAVKRAASLTHRLLAFSRRQTLAPVPTDVNALIHGLEELVRRSVGPSIELSVRHTQGLWTALIDPTQLENALLNLCINARDAMPGGGRITIETANQWLPHSDAFNHEVQAGEYLVVHVTDNGSGMSEEVMAKVFEPFFTTKPVGEGTGLGLSMIYGFARQSGGLVKIQSRPGLGTTVSLYLPRHCAGLETEAVVPSQAPIDLGGSGETVLVVDDEASVRGSVAELLESLGYVVLQAGDSAQGRDLLQSAARIDLLVTDVGLPGGLNGRQMAELGRSARPGLPVLYITGYAQNLALDQCHLQPCTEVLTKPFALEALSERVRMLITQRQP